MAVIRATALSSFPELVREVGGDPDRLLAQVGIDPSDVGRPDVFVPLHSAVTVLEIAAKATSAPNLGRCLNIFERFLGAYSPGLGLRVKDLDAGRSFIEYQILAPDVAASPQHNELAVGVILRVLRHLLGDLHRPLHAHLPHQPLGSPAEYLETIAGDEAATLASVRRLVGRLLPSGSVTLEFVARQMNLHSKTLQRRLAAEGSTFAGVVDTIHRRRLRDSDGAALSYRVNNLS